MVYVRVCVSVCMQTRDWSAASYKGVIVGVRGPEGRRQSDWLRLLCLTLPILSVTVDVITVALLLSLASLGSSEDLRQSQKYVDNANVG